MAKYVEQSINNLFNPNLVYCGDASKELVGYPDRSKNLRTDTGLILNPKFVKDGYAYLLRGAKKGQESGFYSREYARKNTIESLDLDIDILSTVHTICGDTPFISTTTDYYIAASFANKERIYIVKVPVEDVYSFEVVTNDSESEYLIPDFISSDEIVVSFRYDKAGAIYRFLKGEVGLDLEPSDLGLVESDLTCIDYDKLQSYMDFNGDGDFSPLDPALNHFKGTFLSASSGKVKKKINNGDIPKL